MLSSFTTTHFPDARRTKYPSGCFASTTPVLGPFAVYQVIVCPIILEVGEVLFKGLLVHPVSKQGENRVLHRIIAVVELRLVH